MDTLSTTIDTDPTPSASGGGQPALTEPGETNSLRADIEAALKETAPKAEPEVADADDKAEVKEEKAEPKKQAEPKAEAPAKEEEPEAAPAKDEVEAEPKGEPKEEGKGRHPEAPAKFLPRAKELWRNTPNEVKAEVDRVLREAEESSASYKRYDDLREFDELAKSNGRDLRESLTKLNHIENVLAQNPIAGLNMILQEIGPRKGDGQAVSLFEVANFIVNQGQQGYQQMVDPPRQQEPNGEVQTLRAEIAQMKVDQAARDIIEPFAAKHPRYHELQDDIALFLESGKIPASLSAPEKLAAAYDMAVRINPSSHAQPSTTDEPANDRRADSDFGGSAKSIKSSPGSVTEEVEDRGEGGESIRDSIVKAARRLR